MAEGKTLDLGRNHLLYGDCLDMLEWVPDESVDLIYLDPPFKSDTDYNMLFGSDTGEDTAQIKAFADTWYWHAGHDDVYLRLLERGGAVGRVTEAMFVMLGKCGMLAYVLFMTERLIELQRILRPTGSLYLHCDPTASHYLKLVLDAVFGPVNFGNEISWLRAQPKSHATKNFSNSRDIILRYRASDKAVFNKVYGDYDPVYIEKFYKYQDEDGRYYQLGDLVNPNKDRPNLTYKFLGVTRVWRWTKDRMEKAYKDGLIVQSAHGKVPRFKRYLDEMPGQPVTTNWDDIEHLHASAAEYLGYPTQKPLALLRRIIEASSHEGDIVLDPFCGCGTAVDAAQALGRRWIGMDISALAINVIRARLEDVHGPDVMRDVEVTGIPTDVTAARMLFTKDPFDFERWAVGLVHARPNDKQRGDGGSDGTLSLPAREKGRTQRGLVSVKGGANINPAMVRDLNGAVNTMSAAMGILVLMEQPTKGMVTEAAKAGLWRDEFTGNSYPKLQIITIAELLDGKQLNMPTPLNPYTKATYTHNATKQEDWL